ncbi:YhfT family protein [Jeotgalibaca sp. MA1X17-3]|uniref:YhfT family protein n=1 Tax=Jeotgalibaca sp. MA1X17-3 TaxID=2908211 RepID=UPI001F216B10|nr:YhfT family protein [Jeotgalibaca sp. MA1X17-3]UJF15290.1 YhfT family protein [Jeotgalibaca sp. MA1X17-3]
MDIIQLVVVGALGALAAILSNTGIAVFNDGLRPVMPEYLDGVISKKELAATSFAVSFGLVIGFGIPVSIGASIILVHSLLLMTDIIGTWTPDGKKGMIIAGVIGAVYGIALTLGLQAVVDLFAMLPVDVLGALGAVGTPIVIGFAVFPAVAVAYQHGFNKGAITLATSTLVLFIVKRFGTFQLNEQTSFTLSAEGMALLVGMIFMLIFAVQVKGQSDDNQNLVSIFVERVTRIKKNWIILSVAGGLVAAATSLTIIAGDPISLNLLSEGKFGEAALAAFARGIGFIPLVFSTAIVTGVYSPAGTTFVYVAGILLHGNPIFAFLAGAVIMFIEVNLLNAAAKGLDRFPGVRDMGEHIRTAMNRVLEIALLVGGAMASEQIAPGIGFFWVFGAYLMNRTAKKPLVDMAVGPVAAIALGIIVNILYVLGLFAPVV